jgi:hypothetical protein
MKARAKDILAILACQTKGTLWIPFWFRMGIEAVKRKESKVKIPKYIIKGLPKI